MKKIIFIISIIILSSCEKSSLEKNDYLVKKIDDLPFTECTIRIEVDSNTIPIDTISIVKTKIDKKGNKVFKQIMSKYKKQNYISNIYYWEDKTPFLETRNSETGDFKYYSEVFKDKKGLIQQLVSYDEFDGERDSLILNYDYEFTPTGKKSKMTLSSANKEEMGVTIIEFNQNEKVAKEITIIENDTFEIKTYSYKNKKVEESRHVKYSIDTTITLAYNDYDKEGNLILETINTTKSDSTSVVKIKFDYDNKNNWIGYLESVKDGNRLKRVKIKKETCD